MMNHPPFGEMLGKILTEIPGPGSISLAEELSKVEAQGVTYTSTDFPIFWDKALGSNVEDVDGNVFVDLTAAFGVAALGHSFPGIRNAISKQLGALGHGMGDVHPPQIKVEILKKLSDIFPGGGAQTILCNGGAEAVEAALKTAYLKTKKPGVIFFEGGYHGLTYGALPISGQSRFSEPFQSQIAGIGFKAKFPQAKEEDFEKEIRRSISELGSLKDEADQRGKPVGAIVFEPIQGRGGVCLPPNGWLQALRNWADENDILLIADEIMTGFGRTGRRFAVEREEVVPDLLCVGKALTGILPFSACIGKAEVMQAWPKSTGEALHTSTFLGHPLGCAAALASIDEIEKRGLARRSQEIGKETLRDMKTWEKDLPPVKEVRGMGMMIGLELQDENASKGLGARLMKEVLQKGLLILPAGPDGNTISLLPPLTIGKRQLEWGLQTIRRALEKW